tara:strand:+ start:1703 stop:1921 length:219 start_codon:yes stop_codon:yes gene_type:complete
MKHQYWIKNRYKDGFERWELTKGKFSSAAAAHRAYEARAKALHFDIVDVKPHEQFEFAMAQLWGHSERNNNE